MTPTTFVWRLRSRMSPSQRSRVRRFADAALRPVGSIASVRTTDPILGLTFDDGPDPRWTPPLLDLLDEHEVRATFFLLTYRARRHPELVRELVARGHEIGLHGDDHTRLTTLPVRDVARRIRVAKAELEQITGADVRWFRPAFGSQSIPIFLAIRRAGLDVVVWGPIAEDWIDGTPEEVAGRALHQLAPGAILLLHDAIEVPPGEPMPEFDRVAAFDVLLTGLRDMGYAAMPVGQLVRRGRVHRSAWFRP